MRIATPSNHTCLLTRYSDPLPQGSQLSLIALTYIAIRLTNIVQFNDKDHAGLADGTAAPEEHLPRYFAKHGHPGEDPKKTKKNGGGKGNW